MSNRQTFALNAKYTQTEGTSLLSGVQALVRLPLRKGANCGGILPRIYPIIRCVAEFCLILHTTISHSDAKKRIALSKVLYSLPAS
jgi:hypothetical protein